MDFTDLYSTTVRPVFSPGATFIANAVGTRLVVRSVATLAVLRSYLLPSLAPSLPPPSSSSTLSSSGHMRRRVASAPLADKPPPDVTWLGFSADSRRLLAFCASPLSKGATVAYIYDLAAEDCLNVEDGGAGGEPEFVLEPGVEGLTRVEWAGDDRVMGWSIEGLRITVWDLRDPERRTVIQNYKPLARGHAWSSDGRQLYVAERHASKDSVAVYDAHDGFRLLARSATNTTSLEGIALSPRDSHLAVWDHSLVYSLSILLPPLPNPLATFPPPPTPAALSPLIDPLPSSASSSRSTEALGLGVRAVAWHPSGRWLAVGGWDGSVRVLEDVTWGCRWSFEPLRVAGPGTMIWKEPSNWLSETRGRGIVPYHSLSPPQTIPLAQADPARPAPVKAGVFELAFSPGSGSYLLVRLENAPLATFIHPFPPPSSNPASSSGTTVLLQSPPTTASSPSSAPISSGAVLAAVWSPVPPPSSLSSPPSASSNARLTLVTASNGIYTWSSDWIPSVTTTTTSSSSSSSLSLETSGLAECIGVPTPGFTADAISCAPAAGGGSGAVCIVDTKKGAFGLVFEAPDDEEEEEEEEKEEEGEMGGGRVEVEEEMAGLSLVREEDENENEGDWTGFSA